MTAEAAPLDVDVDAQAGLADRGGRRLTLTADGRSVTTLRPPPTLADPTAAAAEYVAWLSRTGLADNTQRGYARFVRGFCLWLGEHPEHGDALRDPYARDHAVRDWRKELLTGGKHAPATVAAGMTAIAAFYGWIGLGRPANVPKTPRSTYAPKALDPRQRTAVLRAAERRPGRGARDLAAVATLMLAGLRVGELSALDLHDAWVTERAGAIQVRYGKGAKPREVPVLAALRGPLGTWIGVRHGHRAAPDEPLFVTASGDRWADRSIRHTIAQIGAAAGVEGLHPHQLRHTFATMLIREEGKDPFLVAELMGHEDLDTTRSYTRPSRAEMTAALDQVTVEW